MFNNEYDINYFLTSKTLKLKESYKDWTKTLSPPHQKLLYTQTEYKGANFNQYIKTNPNEFDITLSTFLSTAFIGV